MTDIVQSIPANVGTEPTNAPAGKRVPLPNGGRDIVTFVPELPKERVLGGIPRYDGVIPGPAVC